MPESHAWAAAGFGGGMGQRDLCGFLTGGFMGIGFAVGGLDLERKEAKARSRPAFQQYWEWWQTQAPPIALISLRPAMDPGMHPPRSNGLRQGRRTHPRNYS